MAKFDFLKKVKSMDRNTVLVAVAIIAIVITGGLIFANSAKGISMPDLTFGLFGKSPKQIGQSAVDYINNAKLANSTVTLKSASEESGMVKISISVGGQSFDSYVTKDGKLLFANPPIAMTSAKTAAKTTASTTVKKTAAPSLEAFVVSSCPYGLQMQRALAEAVKGAPALAANVVVRYIGSITNGQINSMHDSDKSGNPVSNGPEAQENLRQICIRQEQPAKYWSYVSCYMKKVGGTLPNTMPLGDSPSCQASTGIDTAKLASCVKDPAKGIAYAQKDFDLQAKYGASASPTLVLNGTTIDEGNYGGRTADGVKTAVCAGFSTPAGFCSTKLNTAPAAVSFNATYADAAGGATANTNCAPAK